MSSFSFLKSFKQKDCACGTKQSECVSNFLKEEIPEHLKGTAQGIHWSSSKQAAAAAYSYCEKHCGYHDMAIRKISNDATLILEQGRKPTVISPKHIRMHDALAMAGFKELHDKIPCYKMSNVTETKDEFIVPVVLAQALVQPYYDWDEHGNPITVMMAKLPEDLARAQCISYESGAPVDLLPSFELHPLIERRENEVGFVENVKYQPDHERIVGRMHTYKEKISDLLFDYYKERKLVGVSVGFQYLPGIAGDWNGKHYDIAQTYIMLTHLAQFTNEEGTGRCGLKYCAVGKI